MIIIQLKWPDTQVVMLCAALLMMKRVHIKCGIIRLKFIVFAFLSTAQCVVTAFAILRVGGLQDKTLTLSIVARCRDGALQEVIQLGRWCLLCVQQ